MRFIPPIAVLLVHPTRRCNLSHIARVEDKRIVNRPGSSECPAPDTNCIALTCVYCLPGSVWHAARAWGELPTAAPPHPPPLT